MHAQVSALERFYRFFWRNKGDIYHILWDLTRCAVTPDRSTLLSASCSAASG